MCHSVYGTVVPNNKNPPKISSLDLISRVFFQTNLHLFPFPEISFILNICQTVAGISMILQFHDFLHLILGGFLTFGSTVCHSAQIVLANVSKPAQDRQYNSWAIVDSGT